MKQEDYFTEENIFSAMLLVDNYCLESSIDKEDDYNYEDRLEFSISKKIGNQPFLSGYIYYLGSNPRIECNTVLDLNISGSFDLEFKSKHPKFENSINIINKYVQAFMVIYGIEEFDKRDQIYLYFEYCYSAKKSLKLTNIKGTSICLTSRKACIISDFGGVLDLKTYVNKFLKKLNIKKINVNTDMEQVLSLIRMQKTVDEMVLI
jgi:hypothetical protein